MPEAVRTAARAFAPSAWGAVSSDEEAPAPQEPMQTPHPTSQSRARAARFVAARRAPGQAGARRRPRASGPAGVRRPGRRPLHGVRLHHRRPRVGTRGRHVAVGRVRLRQARLGLQGHPQALLHRYLVLQRRRLGDPREPSQRPERRQAQLPQRVHRAGFGRGVVRPGRHDRDDHLVESRLQGRRRLAAQDVHRRTDLHAQVRGAPPHHEDRPRRRRSLPGHGQGRPRQRAHDGERRAAGELPARGRPPRGLAGLAERGPQDAGLRGTRLRAREPAAQ